MTLYNEMLRRRPDLVDILMRPFHYARHNVDRGNVQPWCQQPIFSFWEGRIACSYLRVLIDRAYAMPELPDMTDLQREAMDYLEELAADPELHVTFRLEPGDMLFLNNWITLHRRSEFQDDEDPELRRHLLRIWLSVPNSRPLHPDFQADFALGGWRHPGRHACGGRIAVRQAEEADATTNATMGSLVDERSRWNGSSPATPALQNG